MHERQRENNVQLKFGKIAGSIGFLFILLIPNPSQSQSAESRRVLVEVWAGGDDGLTQRLKVALEGEFKHSQQFNPSEGKKPHTLIVTIPTNVRWDRDGSRTKVLYSVDFTSTDGEVFGHSKGSCWDDDLAKCSARIVSDARLASRKLR